MVKSCIHLYTGQGKGKSTSAAGLCLRAAGSGMPVWFTQFLKTTPTGEVEMLRQIQNVTVTRPAGRGKFSWQMNDQEKAEMCAEHNEILQKVFREANAQEKALLVLDELLDACHIGMADENLLHELLNTKSEGLEVVLTGRRAPVWLEEMADYHTEMTKIKHPYDQGLQARKGIEW